MKMHLKFVSVRKINQNIDNKNRALCGSIIRRRTRFGNTETVTCKSCKRNLIRLQDDWEEKQRNHRMNTLIRTLESEA